MTDLEGDEPTNVKTEDDVFEITDFTNSSDWERFIAQIEEKISDWHLNGYVRLHTLSENELTSGTWEILPSVLNFTGVPFTLTLHRLKEREDSEQFVENTNDDEDKLQLPQYIVDMMDNSNEFPARAHCLARWYGLRCFLILSIGTPNGVVSESKCNLLTSSAAIALANTSCDVPFFVQVQENWRRMFEGHAISSGLSTEFEIVHLKKCPYQYNTLSGLTQVFKKKIGLSSLIGGSSRVSARFTYVLRDWGPHGKWPAQPPDPEALAGNFGDLPSGSFDEPITELQLAVTWPSMMADMITDTEIHSDFKPLTAPCWAIRLCYNDELVSLLGSYLYQFLQATDRTESMSDLLNVIHNEPERDMGQALTRITDTSNKVLPIVPPKLASGITRVVTDSQSLLRKSAHTLGRFAAVRERLSREVLNDINSLLFFHDTAANSTAERQISPSMYTLCHKLKAAPIDSLTHRLAMCIIVVNMCHGGLPAVAQVWHLFVSELRTLLDTGTPLPGIEKGKPDLNTCLLHQKLQMLNYCINIKKQREEAKNLSMSVTESWASFVSVDQAPPTDDITKEANTDILAPDPCSEEKGTTESDTKFDKKQDSDHSRLLQIDDSAQRKDISPRRALSVHSESDDEFFECASEVGSPLRESESVLSEEEVKEEKNFEASEATEMNVKESEEAEPTFCHRPETIDDSYAPEGRFGEHEDLKLLHFDRPLYVPSLQDHAPVTEDLLEEQADVFSKLGDTKEGSKVRAKMQSASLLSDMQAFKAANPGCVIEDFVRWYSPRDFEGGVLSKRMIIENNLWVTSWASAKPIPASRQKRIFDDTKEAEKVLHFLTNLKPSEVAQLLIPSCTHEALVVLKLASEKMSGCLRSMPHLCNQIESRASHAFRSWRMHGSVANQFIPWTRETRVNIEEVFRQISFGEKLMERARSLQHKFTNLGTSAQVNLFVQKLLEHPEVQLENAARGKDGCIVRHYFQEEQNRLWSLRNQNSSETETIDQGPVPALPEPTGREFILRATHAYPTSGSRELPHRMYAVLMRNEFRLASAVSSDTTFF